MEYIGSYRVLSPEESEDVFPSDPEPVRCAFCGREEHVHVFLLPDSVATGAEAAMAQRWPVCEVCRLDMVEHGVDAEPLASLHEDPSFHLVDAVEFRARLVALVRAGSED